LRRYGAAIVLADMQALQVWDLTLVRWRGEAMKPYVDRPE